MIPTENTNKSFPIRLKLIFLIPRLDSWRILKKIWNVGKTISDTNLFTNVIANPAQYTLSYFSSSPPPKVLRTLTASPPALVWSTCGWSGANLAARIRRWSATWVRMQQRWRQIEMWEQRSNMQRLLREKHLYKLFPFSLRTPISGQSGIHFCL